MRGDIGIVLGGNSVYDHILIFPLAAIPGIHPNRLLFLERQRILIAGEVDVQHGRTIGIDGDGSVVGGVIFFIGEMLTVGGAPRQAALVTGRARGSGNCLHRFRGKNGVFIVIRVLAPVDDGVVHRRALPNGVERGRLVRHKAGNGTAVRHRAPAPERITGTLRHFHLIQVDGLTVLDILGIHRRAALGIKGDPVACRRYGGDVGVARHGGIRRKGSLRVLHDPTGDGKIAIRHIVRRGDHVVIVLRGLQGAIDSGVRLVRREEEDVVDFGEPGVHAHGFICRKAGDGHGEVQLLTVNIPAFELLALRHFGRGGFGDRFALGDDLRIYHFFSIIEGVGGKILAIVRIDNLQRRDLRRRNAGACVAGIDQGERIDGEHTHEHEHREQHRREFSHFPKHERPLLQHVTGWVKLSARAQARHLQREKRRATRPARKSGGRGACPYRRRGRVSPPGR